MEAIMTAKELALYLKISANTVRRLANQGKIPGFQVGGQWRFLKEAIDDLLRDHNELSD